MQEFYAKVAVITGAASGFGAAFARHAAALGMRLVLADIEEPRLAEVAGELRGSGAEVLAQPTDVSSAEAMDRLAATALQRYGAVHLLFNNAGVAVGGFVWEHGTKDWEWVLGVNLWGVIHGVRCFVPIMLRQDEACHVVNTASVAGLLSAQTMGVYNTTKHAVVTLSETLYHDLRIAGAKIGVTLLLPAFVNTGIAASERNRPAMRRDNSTPTPSQLAAADAVRKATAAGRLSADDIARMTFEAIRENRFYLVTHPRILGSVELRLQDIIAQRDPSDPLSFMQRASSPGG